jgi:shikimate dehydrogenase
MTGSKLYGLIGYPLSHSFSAEYFRNKFREEGVDNSEYRLFELQNLSDIRQLLAANQNLVGLNVTIPYKKLIINYLDSINRVAAEIGAVNCIKIDRQENRIKLEGFNTDSYGFEESIKPMLKPFHQKAMILGTGGSARAVAYTLKKLGMDILFVSRNPHDCNQVRYQVLNESVMNEHLLVVNTTPIGMYPNTLQFPDIPYDFITEKHLFFDLIYNPELTVFLEKALQKGAVIKNGMEMLQLQAERSWEIWKF